MSDSDERIAEISRDAAFVLLEKLKNQIESDGDTWSEGNINGKLRLLDFWLNRFNTFQSILECSLGEQQFGFRFDFEQQVSDLKERLLTMNSGRGFSSTPLAQTSRATRPNFSAQYISLPPLPLVKFDGSYERWNEFISVFHTLVHTDNQLSAIEKFRYLKEQLIGDAPKIIQSLEYSEENYKKALELLHERYEDKNQIFRSHLNSFMNLESVPKFSAKPLRKLVDTIDGEFRALTSLASKEQLADALLINIVCNKLDIVTKSKWQDAAPTNALPSWNNFLDFLKIRCRKLENAPQIKREEVQHIRKRDSRGRILVNVVNQLKQFQCSFCLDDGHSVYKCVKFAELPVRDRFSAAKRLKLCLNCLKPGHLSKNCSSGHCRLCKSGHHTLLHFDSLNSQETKGVNKENVKTSNSVTILTSSHNQSIPAVLLATAVVKVSAANGLCTTCRILLDSASQANFVTSQLVQQLALKPSRCSSTISGIGRSKSTVKGSVELTLHSRNTSFNLNLNAFVLANITTNHPASEFDVDNWNIPANIPLADPSFNKSGRIDILIGAEHFLTTLCVGQIRLSRSLPTLQKTLFGWIISGPYSTTGNQYCLNANINNTPSDSINTLDSINQMVKSFWEIENIGSIKGVINNPCEIYFAETFSRNESGRFVVRLPFKENPSSLGTSRLAAEMRLKQLHRKFACNPDFKIAYVKFMREYEALGHMSECTANLNTIVCDYFIPHHGIFQESGGVSKLRVVFDASFVSSSGKSLNDILRVGPTVQEDIFSILCRFRMYPFVLTADISKMYRQILIHPKDASFQRILWKENAEDPTKEYCLKTVTYGTASAPFLATRCLVELGKIYEERFPLASDTILHDVYVDDILTGANSINELNQLRLNLISILATAGMKLHKWNSNSKDILENLHQEGFEETVEWRADKHVKTLGLFWTSSTDVFSFKCNNMIPSRITKRTILSTTASIFDPLGLVNPVTTLAKMLLQKIWKLKLNWDESLPADIHSVWSKFSSQLSSLKTINFNRCIIPTGCRRIEMHGFADASQRAYGACIYLKTIDDRSKSQANLICAKSRIAPLKPTTIPRLELCAALLLAELINKVLGSQRIEITRVFCWSDSSIVLAWLDKPLKGWNVFVANRVQKICNFNEQHHLIWKHVRTTENPADIISRGSFPTELRENKLWFHGPEFLLSTDECYLSDTMMPDTNLELSKTKTCLAVSNEVDTFSLLKHCNNFVTTVRAFAYVLRFIAACRQIRNPHKQLTASELLDGEIAIVKFLQRSKYLAEIRDLKKGRSISSKSYILTLHPFIDDKGIVRVGGRITNADLSFENRHQILLPDHPFTRVMIRHWHESNLHTGCQSLHAIIRSKYWIPNGNRVIRSVVRKCLTCFRARPIAAQQIMGNLPKERVSFSYPFETTGIDFCGPFLIRNSETGSRSSKGPSKGYVCLYICLATKAVHLELVGSLSTDSFTASLQRFISRRGLCRRILSDNGTNFVGSNRLLKEFYKQYLNQNSQSAIINFCQSKGIEWKFIPPRSPHFGGLWEASIKKIKYHLVRMMSNTTMTAEEFITLIVRIEAVINSRPLTPLSSDPQDLQTLTPAHFLIGRPLTSLPEPEVSHLPITHLSRWQLITRLTHHFWNRWHKEYLNTLQQRAKWLTRKRNISEGTLVLLKDETTPSSIWPLGRIVKSIFGKDGHVRVVDVKTSNGIFRRAIHKVCPLPLDEHINTENNVEVVTSRRGAC